ncbi:WD repeat-containing protein 11-like [Pomacea canaliculata]|uniref:WD repeat-containing protein 11-like n=1 Tax=Pomacea canaliculata TaxID=400727 RepID=UPI000D725BC6|nr:WD repeat-containing protein 11-like [Pomacea canaliculata]
MMKLFPKIITGPLHAQNKGSCDWGWQGLLAYGCQNLVTVIDPRTVQVLQVLDKHKGIVTQVKWANENYHHDLNSPYNLRLASADSMGTILVWDVMQGSSRTEFADGNKPVQALEWLRNQDASRDLLVALHPPYTLILWNADTGTRLWKKSYTEMLLSFTFDPFNLKNLAFLGQDCIIFVNDFTITKTPSSNGKKFYISNPSTQGMPRSSSSGSLDRKGSASKNLAKRMTRILVGESKPSNKTGAGEEESVALNECLQLSFHRSCRHHILLLYPREILILDLQINQTVGIIAMDRTSSPFTQVIACWQRDVLVCLHENGSLSVRVRRKTHAISTPAPEGHGAFDDTPPSVSLDVAYDLRCQSDPLRVTRHNRVSAAAMCPASEKSVALVMSDSRVIFWELKTSEHLACNSTQAASPLHSPGSINMDSITSEDVKAITFPILSNIPRPVQGLSDMIATSIGDAGGRQGQSVQLKFLMTGLLNGISSHITAIRMCPPMTNKNWDIYEPILALGTYSGTVQLANAASGHIEREYSLHSSTVRGIEWTSLKHFISHAFPNPGPSGLVRNEVLFVDTISGRQTQLRANKDEETPIEQLQVSHLKQYFVITFKDKPLELWDLRSQTIIRELPRSFPRPTSMAWSPSHSLKTLKKRLLDSSVEEKSPLQKLADEKEATQSGSQSTDNLDTGTGKEKKNQAKVPVREHFVMTDKDCTVFHFIVEGNAISDVTKIPPESGLGRITSMAWKGDFLVFGDAEGVQCLWDLKAKVSRTTPTNRGWIKKIRFAPGRENMKFFTLHNDGVMIWDITTEGKAEILHTIKSPKEISKVVDCEWAGSDRPAIVTANSCLHIMTLDMRSSSSSIDNWELAEPVLCPYLLSSKGAGLLKSLLQHQVWQQEYSFTLTDLREEDRDLQNTISSQMALLDSSLKAYLSKCQFGTAERCLIVARLFGDEAEVHFWTVALHYLRIYWSRSSAKDISASTAQWEGGDRYIPPTPSYQEASDLVVLMDSEDEQKRKRISVLFEDQPLERCYDALCDNQSYKKYQLDRVALHDSKRATYDHTQKCAENYIMLGQTDRAVQLLLETEAENESYYIDSLRACLVASVRSSGASQSTMKLVGTNLIASGRLAEGVQLLCLIDKGLDACRYLQTYGSWDQAVWLAKSTLDFNECNEVMKRWADHLCTAQVNQKSKALLVMLSLGQFHKVVEMLYSMRCFDRAACFIEACIEFGVLAKTNDTGPLFEAVFLEYARYLINLGHGKGASHYCSQAGEKGSQLHQEVCILFG